MTSEEEQRYNPDSEKEISIRDKDSCSSTDQNPSSNIRLRRCVCHVCLKDLSCTSKKCYCNLWKELTLYFYYKMMKAVGLESYQQIQNKEKPEIKKNVSTYSEDENKYSEESLQIERDVQLVDHEGEEERHSAKESSSDETMKVVYTNRAPLSGRKMKIIDDPNTDGKRRQFFGRRRLTMERGSLEEQDHRTRSPISRSREKIKDSKKSEMAANLRPITEDILGELPNENLFSTTMFEYDWFVKREENVAKITFKNGNTYVGEVCDKLPHGKGTFRWADGTVYEGQFEDGSPSGRGRMELPDLSVYTGEFLKGYFHGRGVYNIRSTSMAYSGDWKYGKKHGFGWLLYGPGVWYEGEFKDNLRDGKGFFRFKDKSCYEGQYSKNKREGQGAMRWANNDIYIGQWSDGIPHGLGEYAWGTEFEEMFLFPVQHYYKGAWVKGKRTGAGVMFFGNENGAKMAGYFKDNFKHGAAVVVCGNGRSVEKNPLFHNDKPIQTPTSREDLVEGCSSSTINEQLSQRAMKDEVPFEKECPTKNRTSQVLELAKQEKADILCSPIEIQIHASPEDVDLSFYLEKAFGMYTDAFDTIQFDIDSNESSARSSTNTKIPLSKWNLMSLNSEEHSKPNRSQDNEFLSCGSQSLNPVVPPTFNIYKDQRLRMEDKYLRNVITRHLPKLMVVYYHYATITSPKKVYFKHYMIRMFLWQLYLDIGITKAGISLVQIDKLLDENPASFVECCHHPFEHIYFFQFIQSLMGTALLVHHRSEEEVHSIEGLTPYIFQKFLVEWLFTQAGSHQGRCLFEYKDVLPIQNVYALYLKLGQPHSARTFLNATCTKKGEDPPCYKSWSENKSTSSTLNFLGRNANFMGHNFMYIPEKENIGQPSEKQMNLKEDIDPFFQDLSTFRVLGAKIVVKCLSAICPPIKKNNIICNMDYPMTFLEFYEVLLCCALLMVARNRKRQEVLKVLSSRVNKSEDVAGPTEGARKSSAKFKRMKK